MNKKYDKNIIAQYDRYIDGENFEVYVLEDKEYFNIHVISEKYAQNEMNTLRLQEPKECVSPDYFTKDRMIGYLLEHFIWGRFYNEGIFSGYVVSEFEQHN